MPVKSTKKRRLSKPRSFLGSAKRSFVAFYVKSGRIDHEEGDKFVGGSGLKAKLGKVRWIRTIVSLILLTLIFFSFVFSVFGASARGTYTSYDWNMPSGGFTEMKHSLSVEQFTPNSSLFWSHQFKFVGGDGGYVGLQPAGGRVDGTFGKTVLFSVFGSAVNATKGACVLESAGFDGYNTSGTSCRVAYDWVAGRKYTFRVKLVASDTKGNLWQAWIKDEFTGVETSIAQIRVPRTWTGIGNWSVMWTEYFGNTSSSKPCSSLPYSKVIFYSPVANGSVSPRSSRNYLSNNVGCNDSSISNVPGGVMQKMGIAPSTNSNKLIAQNNSTKTVECAYSTFLMRKPDESGGAYWRKRYVERGYDLKDLAKGLLSSNEGQTKAYTYGFDNFIKRMYTSCLNRPAPAADVTAWGTKNMQGVSWEDIFVFSLTLANQQITQ